MSGYRDTHAGTLDDGAVGNGVQLAGWAQRIRDQGGVIFIDLRDATGVIQVVVSPETSPELMDTAHSLRREFCIAVEGSVRARPEGTENPELATGKVEVEASGLRVLSPAEPLPFQLDERTEIDESIRLQYRYLDLRRPRMAANLAARSAVIRAMRRTLDDLGFLEVETPTLIRSTPEGARDFLVPSRLQRGHFYALPQSPQLFKQMLMIAGVDRYFQIARCYRDEDFRADRQVEFSQLDLEGAFWSKEDVWSALEEVMAAVVRETRGIQLSLPFPRLRYSEALARYGTDKPDTRFGLEISELSEVFMGSEFRAFTGALEAGGTVRGINIGSQELSRTQFDGLIEDAQKMGAKGLVWAVVEPDGSLRSPVAKFLSADEQEALTTALGAAPGDVVLVVADTPRVAAAVLGALRLKFGQPAGHEQLNFLWVTDFPVFEETEAGLAPSHHPFTAPVDVDEMRTSPATAISQAYDLVLNGSELGSGSVRIHDPATQAQVFEILGIEPADAERRFGWFMEALRYGTPPHAGFAVGIDRLVSLLQDEPNIREVIPFPKTQTGSDPLTGSPGRVDEVQLFELGLDVRAEVRAAWEEAKAPE